MDGKIRATTSRNRTGVFDKLGGNPVTGVVLKVPRCHGLRGSQKYT